jgi:5-formyltetrahydrofolate cyclo-ligase
MGLGMSKISEAKAAARTAAFAARKAAHGTGLDAAAVAHLLRAVPDSARSVSGFMAIRTEVSPLEAMVDLHARGVTVSVPVIEAAGRPLKFSRWTPDCALRDGPFGALIPEIDDFVLPKVLITPLVAFDGRGYRLGYGGGFYDRTFVSLRRHHPVLTIGFAYSAQELPEVPIEPTDQRLDMIVTETGIRRF